MGGGKLEWGRGRSVYKQPGTRVDGDRTTQRGGIQGKRELSREGSKGTGKGNSQGVAPWLSILNLCICIMILCECS